jgi:hypothetical protein
MPAALVLPSVAPKAMQVFLDDFAKTIGPDEHVVMVLDQAGGCLASAPMHHACAVAAYSPSSIQSSGCERPRRRGSCRRDYSTNDSFADTVCKA